MNPPIFILAPLPRSGTNFLWDLLRLHQDCSAGRSPIWEDYLLKNSHHLTSFVQSAQQSWDPVWGPTEHFRAPLAHALGDALVRFMTIDPQRRLVTKSPSLDNLEHFFNFFPRAHLALLVRDGRDVVDSGMATFGWNLKGAAHAWAAGIDRVYRFIRREDIPRDQCSVVRYEDLVDHPVPTIQQLLRELRLPEQRFDFGGIENLPVRGSSHHRGNSSETVHWNPVPRTASFRPTRRWEAWDADARAYFTNVAGDQLRRFGYEV